MQGRTLVLRSRAWASAGLAAAMSLASFGHADDLAALARKEKARRAKIASPVKVLTEGDAASNPGNVTQMEGVVAPGPVKKPTAGEQGPTPEEVWRARANASRAAVTAAEKSLVQIQRELERLSSDLTQVSAAEAQDPLRLQKKEAAMAAMREKVEAARAAVTAANAGVAAVQEEARRAGVPAGWLR